MLEFKVIEITDKEAVQPFLKQNNVRATERNFACLFIWASHYNTQLCITDKYCFIRMKGEGDTCFSYYPPLMKVEHPSKEEIGHAIDMIAELEKSNHIYFFSLMKEQAQLYQEILGDQIELIESRNYSDYIYNANDLIELAGKKYSAKRNHINKFNKLYGDCYEYTKIDFEKDLSVIMDFHNKWCIEKDENGREQYQHENCAIRKAAYYAKELGLKGGILLVNNEVVAYTIGCETNEDTFDVLFEKGTIEIEGSYAMINQCFAKETFGEYKMINREEDLGIEGLRKAKLSYYPEVLLEKFSAVVKFN